VPVSTTDSEPGPSLSGREVLTPDPRGLGGD